MKKNAFFGIYHVADWRIFPWIQTAEDGWVFSWLFLFFGIYIGDPDDLESDDD